jgi:hypothetical protein
MTEEKFPPLHPNPSCYWSRDEDDMRIANIFHRDKPGVLVIQIRSKFADRVARQIIELHARDERDNQ